MTAPAQAPTPLPTTTTVGPVDMVYLDALMRAARAAGYHVLAEVTPHVMPDSAADPVSANVKYQVRLETSDPRLAAEAAELNNSHAYGRAYRTEAVIAAAYSAARLYPHLPAASVVLAWLGAPADPTARAFLPVNTADISNARRMRSQSHAHRSAPLGLDYLPAGAVSAVVEATLAG